MVILFSKKFVPLHTTTAQTYDNLVTSGRYLIGQPVTKTVTNVCGGTSWVNEETIAYNANRLPESRISYIQDNKINETRWTYDAYGNITSELSAPYDVATFLGTTFTYDAECRNLASSTNALGQTTTYTNYDKFGHAGTVIDFKHGSTSYQYDAWGQLISTQHPDGTKEEVKTDWGGQGLIGQQLEEVEEEFQINISLRIQLIKTFIKTFFMKRKNGTGVIMNLLQ